MLCVLFICLLDQCHSYAARQTSMRQSKPSKDISFIGILFFISRTTLFGQQNKNLSLARATSGGCNCLFVNNFIWNCLVVDVVVCARAPLIKTRKEFSQNEKKCITMCPSSITNRLAIWVLKELSWFHGYFVLIILFIHHCDSQLTLFARPMANVWCTTICVTAIKVNVQWIYKRKLF